MLDFILGSVFMTIFVALFSASMLIVIDKQEEWNHRNKK